MTTATSTSTPEIIDLTTARRGARLLDILAYLKAQPDADNMQLYAYGFRDPWDIYEIYDAVEDTDGLNPDMDNRIHRLQEDMIFEMDEHGTHGTAVVFIDRAAHA